MTDGGNNKGEEPTIVAQDSPVRIFPIGIGVPESQDVALTHMIMESKLFIDDPVRTSTYASSSTGSTVSRPI